MSIPQNGLPNSTEDPKVVSDLTILQNVINGNLDGSNLSSTAGILRLAARNTAVSTVAATGELIITTTAGKTVTLPAPVSNGLVGVVASSLSTGASPTTVAGTNIYGVGLNPVSSFVLGTGLASVVLQSDGTNWYVISGQQDTGWVALTLSTNWIIGPAGTYAPAARLVGNTVFLRGGTTNNTGAGSSNPGSVPAAMIPAANVQFAGAIFNSQPTLVAVNSGTGVIATAVGLSPANSLLLDGARYALS